MSKPFIGLDEQIDRLKGRGLIITNVESAKRQLLKTSYYDLINGYKDLFLLPKKDPNEEDRFVEGTKFEDLTRLYLLDREIRHIVMRAVLDVECNFYTAISHCISEKFGEKHEEYLKMENYKRGVKQSKRNYERDNLLSRINKRINLAQERPLKYYKEKYNNVPPWILVKHLSFGELIVWYKVSPSDVKDNIIRSFTGLEPNDDLKEIFIKSMEFFNKFRNRAAHGGRMYNFKTNIEIPYKREVFNVLNYDEDDYKVGLGKSDFCAFLLSLLFLYQADYRNVVLEQVVYLSNNLLEYQKESPHYFERVLNLLGLPIEYEDLIHNQLFGPHYRKSIS